MEYLDILDENGNKTGEKDTRENIHKLGLLHSDVTTYKSKKVKDDIINNKFFNICNVEIGESQFKKIKIQKEELEDIKLFSIDEIENILNSEDKHYKFPQKSELAIIIIKEKITWHNVKQDKLYKYTQ